MNKANRFVGAKIGMYAIASVGMIDSNTNLISCEDMPDGDEGQMHLEAEHWLDENTFHYNMLYYDKVGNLTDTAPLDLKPQLMRSFEHIFCSLANA